MSGIEEQDYKKDKEEFENTLDAIFSADSDISDEEINETLDKELGSKSDGSGESNDDSTQNTEDPITSGVVPDESDTDTSQAKKPATGNDDQTDWKTKCEETEALLAKERQKTKSWDGRIQAANKRAEEAEIALSKVMESKKAEPSEEDISDQEKLQKFRDDFPELGDVVDIMERRISKVSKSQPAKDVKTDVVKPEEEEVDNNTHRDTIIAEHPELDEMVGTGVLTTWINTQGEYIRPSLKRIYQSGSASEINTMLTEFKTQTGWKSQLKSDSTARAKQAKLDAMKDVGSHSGGPIDNVGPDKNDYDKGVEDAFKETK